MIKEQYNHFYQLKTGLTVKMPFQIKFNKTGGMPKKKNIVRAERLLDSHAVWKPMFDPDFNKADVVCQWKEYKS